MRVIAARVTGVILAAFLAAGLAACGNTIATPLPAPVAQDRADVEAERTKLKRELADIEKKKQTHQQDAINKIERGE